MKPSSLMISSLKSATSLPSAVYALLSRAWTWTTGLNRSGRCLTSSPKLNISPSCMPFVSNVEISPTIPTGRNRSTARSCWVRKSFMSPDAGIAIIRCRRRARENLTYHLVMKGSLSQIWALFKKDLLLEVRQQYSFYGVLLYVASTIFVLYLAMGQPEADVWKGLFWMIQLFVCVNAVAKSFLQEGRGRLLYFYSITGATNFILSKLFFNGLLMILMSLLSLGLFILMLGDPMPEPVQFIFISWLGGVSLSLVFTFLAAIAARAQQSAALMAILGFPLVIPQLLLLNKISNIAFASVLQGGLGWMIAVLAALDVMIVVLSLILFPFLWKD